MHVPNLATGRLSYTGSIIDEIESQPIPEAEEGLTRPTANGILRGGI